MSSELLIMRHAKSAWNTNAPSDFHRGLSPRGKSAAALIGHWLVQNDAVPDRIIASSAVRVIETLDIVVRIIGIKAADIKLNRDLYAARVETWMQHLTTIPEDVGRVMICGHNPELEALSISLSSTDIPTAENGKLMPTATVVRLHSQAPWSKLKAQTMNLKSVVRPRDLEP